MSFFVLAIVFRYFSMATFSASSMMPSAKAPSTYVRRAAVLSFAFPMAVFAASICVWSAAMSPFIFTVRSSRMPMT